LITPKKPPYENTKADPDKTEMAINKLLRLYGINRYQWDKDFQNSRVALVFETEAEIQGIKKTLLIKVMPPTFAAKRRTWNETKGTYENAWLPNWAQSYRLLFHWLKAKIEAIAYGLTTVEKEFLSQIVISLPDGQASTIGEQIESLSSQFALASPNPEEVK
jgi:hypothetical protein